MRVVREGFVVELDAPSDEELHRALAGYGVVVLRGLRPDAPQLEDMARKIGEPVPRTGQKSFPTHPGCVYVHVMDSDTDASPSPDTSLWHTDHSFRPDPARYTMLQSRVMPDCGGDTLFADMAGAYARLPSGWKAALDGAVGTHTHPLRAESARHPVVRRVPESGQPVLYLNQLCLTGITGISAPSVDDLVAHATGEEFVHRHRWCVDDVVVWDNARVMHRAESPRPGGRRVMHRVLVRAPVATRRTVQVQGDVA